MEFQLDLTQVLIGVLVVLTTAMFATQRQRRKEERQFKQEVYKRLGRIENRLVEVETTLEHLEKTTK